MIIETETLCKYYGRLKVLQGIDLQVPEGSAFALLGTNGAGKTTTLRTLVNIIRPSSGAARIFGKDSQRLSYADFRNVGYVSENQKLPDRLSIARLFEYLRVLYPRWDSALEAELRKQLDLPPDRLLSRLSHGMRMKTVLVSALCFRPRLLILDEPLSGLDSLVRDEVVEGILQQADETTILISSHEISEIENFTTHIAFMDRGKLLFQESIDSLKDRFRQVSVTLSAEKALPATCPESWIAPQISGHVLHTVVSDYKSYDGLLATLNEFFGAINCIVEPMGLREITKSLIKSGREAQS